MYLKKITLLIGIFFGIKLQAQLVTIKVVDSVLKTPLSKATIIYKNKLWLTDENGIAHITVEKQEVIKITNVGYIEKSIKIINEMVQVEMVNYMQSMDEVTIYNKPENIVLKALRKIKDNYYNKPIITEGFLEFEYIKKQKFNEALQKKLNIAAILQVDYDSYVNKNTIAQTYLIQNIKTVNETRTDKRDSVSFIGHHNLPSSLDLIKRRVGIASITENKNYTINVLNKVWYNTKRCFIISYQKDNNNFGTLVIDTATFAIYEINEKQFNIPRRYNYIPIDYSNIVIKYDFYENKLILKSIDIEKFLNNSTFNIYDKQIYTTKLYNVVKKTDYLLSPALADEKIKRFVSNELWKPYTEKIMLTKFNFDSLPDTKEVVNTNKLDKKNVEKAKSFSKRITFGLGVLQKTENITFINNNTLDTLVYKKSYKIAIGQKFNFYKSYSFRLISRFVLDKKILKTSSFNVALIKSIKWNKYQNHNYIVPIVEYEKLKYINNKNTILIANYLNFGLGYNFKIKLLKVPYFTAEIKYNYLLKEKRLLLINNITTPINFNFFINYN